MGVELVEKLYAAGDFIPLSEHSAQTPATFFGATPVLHLSCPKSRVRLDKDALSIAPDLAKLGEAKTAEGEQLEVEDVDIWVTSKFLALSSSATSSSIRIDYPTIAVHGQKDDAVMILLRISPDDPSVDEESLQLHIFPFHAEHGTDPAEDTSSVTNGHGGKHYATLLYTAIGDCQELNPDPETNESEDGEDDGAATFPSGGWITSENMHEFVDEDGNFSMPGSLGPGAGNVRTADDATINEESNDDAKWQRTD